MLKYKNKMLPTKDDFKVKTDEVIEAFINEYTKSYQDYINSNSDYRDKLIRIWLNYEEYQISQTTIQALKDFIISLGFDKYEIKFIQDRTENLYISLYLK